MKGFEEDFTDGDQFKHPGEAVKECQSQGE
jgi:hypothetical protein